MVRLCFLNFLLLNVLQAEGARPVGTFDPSIPTEPEWKDHHPDRVHGKHFYAFHGLHLKVKDVSTHSGEHSVHKLTHHYSERMRHPHTNKGLWKYVEKKCSESWSHTKPEDHHFAASVHLAERKVYCWSGYHADDVTAWQNDFESVTYLAHIDALGSAPRAFWYTSKFDTRNHDDDDSFDSQPDDASLDELEESNDDSLPEL